MRKRFSSPHPLSLLKNKQDSSGYAEYRSRCEECHSYDLSFQAWVNAEMEFQSWCGDDAHCGNCKDGDISVEDVHVKVVPE